MKKYGSDFIADMLLRYNIPFAAMNPGASVRGLHDSIVNYTNGTPRIIECAHEEISVGIAHGYAKVTGKPMAVILHSVVGLLHACLAIYVAYLDRAPIIMLGASGPMAVGRRRPRVDWDHTAVIQGSAIRDYVKWDDLPFDAVGASHGFARGYRVATTEPQGPVYICYDISFLEDELKQNISVPNPKRGGLNSLLAMEKKALDATVTHLLAAKQPVIIADLVGRHQESVEKLVKLAEFLAAPVIDLNGRFNFPNTHPLFELDLKILQDADLVLALDVRDLHGCIGQFDEQDRPTEEFIIDKNCYVINIGVEDLEVSSWSQNSMRFVETDLSILADTSTVLPDILEALKCRVGEAALESSIMHREERIAMRKERHIASRTKWRNQAEEKWDSSPMTAARMVLEVGEAIKDKDWVLTANTVKNWARKLWDFDKPYRHPGRQLGTATQIGISLGVALAYKGSGKLVVDIEPDGDLMYDLGALWIAAHDQIPILVVMYNNRAYFNSWNHQMEMAKSRERNQENVPIGTEIDSPPPDFAGIARAQGWYAEGPITTGDELRVALKRAIAEVEKGRPALIDAVTLHR